MSFKYIAKWLLPPIFVDTARWMVGRRKKCDADDLLQQYFSGGRVPWSPGYFIYWREAIRQALADRTLIERIRNSKPLPPGYCVGVEERCIEYPWLLAHLREGPGVLLDAGSTLNYDFILEHPVFRQKVIDILTLAPEEDCFWRKGISYLFHDLRDIPIRDAYYDIIVCLSTLEHVGCDNTLFTKDDARREHRPEDFLLVMREFHRVLKPGGILFLTVPYGVYRHFGTFQQFDHELLSRAVEAFSKGSGALGTFYRYTAEGWNQAQSEDCDNCEYVEWVALAWLRNQWPNPLPVEADLAAAARAVACLQLIKS